ncbi:hypothetical protein LINPERHAP2_LOCUS7379 [Linum perenne]
MQEDQVQNPNCPRIPFSEEEIRSFYKPWSKALVVKVLEKTFSFLTVKRRLESLWAKSGRIQVCDLANNFFLVRFSEAVDYHRAAFDGPWKVAVSMIGNFIGRTVRLDLATSKGARARYARLCVEVDLSKPLLGKYIIEDRVHLIEYESLEDICFGCGFYGHKLGSCTLNLTDPPPEKIGIETAIPVEPPTSEATEGSWMTVQRRQKKKGPKSTPVETKSKNSGSRFEILQSNNNEERISSPLGSNPSGTESEQVSCS